MVITTVALSISFLVYVIVGQYVFAFQLGWFPVQGWSDSTWTNLITYAPLPVLLAVMVGVAPQTRLYRSFFLDELGQDYVRTARAKGMTERVVLFKHVLRNAMIPILTNIGLQLPGIFVGSFLIEVFFSIPGLGREVLLAVNRSDYPVIQAVDHLPGDADDGDQPAHRPGLQGGRPAGGAQMSAVPSRRRRTGAPGALRRRLACRLAPLQGRPRGHGLAGHRGRLRAADLAAGWPGGQPVAGRGRRAQRAAHLLGPAPARGHRRHRGPRARRRPVRHRPAGAALQGMGRARGPVPDQRDAVRPRRCPLGGDRLGRDVLAKAIKGTEISVFVGVLAALVATLIGTLLGAFGGFFGGKVGDFLEWLYNVFESPSPTSC
jgi:ABC-type dipeptide/oligopeptide/nickel transport system permease subunit